MRSFNMNLIGLTALVLILLPFAATAQRPPSTSVCSRPDKDSPDAILTICVHERGMTAYPQPRLFLRVFADGRAQYERNGTSTTLVKKELRITPYQVNEIQCLGREPDFRAAEAFYPAHHMGTDSSRVTTVIFRDAGKAKKIVLKNYWAGLDDNVENYPSSFNALMSRATWIWERAMGIFNPPPAVSFCEMVEDRKTYLNGRRLGFFADLEHHVTTTADGRISHITEYLWDHECRPEKKGKLDLVQSVGVAYAGDQAAANELRAKTAKIERKPFYGRARVFITGILRENRKGTPESYDHVFEIDEIKTMDPVALPYKGVLENGWIYSDIFDAESSPLAKGVSALPLSAKLHGPPNHSVSIEWKNLAAYPSLRRRGRKHITFRVIYITTQMIEKNRWNDVYTCEIMDAK